MNKQDFPAADLRPLIVFAFDGQGAAREVDPRQVEAEKLEPPAGGFVWVHLNRGAPATSASAAQQTRWIRGNRRIRASAASA